MLKHRKTDLCQQVRGQPPSGGCVLKLILIGIFRPCRTQPPSGGCVLKHIQKKALNYAVRPAAFRRLCVETGCISKHADRAYQPPSGGCVLKPLACRPLWVCRRVQPPSGGCVLKRQITSRPRSLHRPAAFRRLCVETQDLIQAYKEKIPAAFRRLCVETSQGTPLKEITKASRLQAAVC